MAISMKHCIIGCGLPSTQETEEPKALAPSNMCSWEKSRGGRPQVSEKVKKVYFDQLCKREYLAGFHNWLFFLMEERKGDVDYHGFSKKLSFGHGKGGIMKTVFEWEGHIKPVSSIFMGLSPELELALYTLCVLLKPDDDCTVSLGGKTIDIQTYTFKHGGKKFLSSAFPQF